MIIDWTRVVSALDQAFGMLIAGLVAGVSIVVPALFAWWALQIAVSFLG